MATDPPADLTLAPLAGDGRTVREWLTTFHLAFVALDPFTNEGAWILPTALRILTTFDQADVRVALVVTADPDECRVFLGPLVDEILVFPDPGRQIVRAFGIERLPAFIHLAMDGTIGGSAESWTPQEWKAVADELARVTSWQAPVIPTLKDPGPFEGTPAVPQLAT